MEKVRVSLFIDESAHLENDKERYMVIGAIYVPVAYITQSQRDIKKIKANHGFRSDYEIKWTKISNLNINLAMDLIKYFFDSGHLGFRGYIIDKSCLNHETFSQDHDTWYYKMMYKMIEFIQKEGFEMNIYLDIKDTRSKEKMNELYRILSYQSKKLNYGDIKKVQAIQSQESQIIQITDILIGALRYKKSNYSSSNNKLKIIDYISELSGQNLETNSSLENKKFNIFHWSMPTGKEGVF